MTNPPTIKDVARRAGVSFKTVSRVVNGVATVQGELRERVEASIEALGYRPNLGARQIRSGKTSAIAIIVGSRQEVGVLDQAHRMPSYANDVMTGMLQACSAAEHHLTIDTLATTEKKQGRAALARYLDQVRPDGLLLMPPLCDLEWLLDEVAERGVPLARLNPGTRLDEAFCIGIDNFAAATEVAQFLLAKGHRHIGLITGPDSHYAATARLTGVKRAICDVKDAKLSVRSGDFQFESGFAHGSALLDLTQPPTAIFAGNDEMAAGVLAAAIERKLSVPSDLSIVGFGGLIISEQTWPRITTVSQPTIAMARIATEFLIKTSTGSNEPPPIGGIVMYQIVHRDSVSAARSRSNRAPSPT